MQTELEYLLEVKRLMLIALENYTNLNDFVNFGWKSGFERGCFGNEDAVFELEERIKEVNQLIESVESQQYDPAFEADRLDYIKTVNEAYNSAKAGSK